MQLKGRAVWERALVAMGALAALAYLIWAKEGAKMLLVSLWQWYLRCLKNRSATSEPVPDRKPVHSNQRATIGMQAPAHQVLHFAVRLRHR